MRFWEMIKELIVNEIPMSAESKLSLAKDLEVEYLKHKLSDAEIEKLQKEGTPLTFAQKFYKTTDHVYWRVFWAGLFLKLTIWVREIRNPKPEEKDEEDY